MLNIGSYENNFLPAPLRKELGWKVTDANAGKQAIGNLKDSVVAKLFQSVIAKGLAALFAEDRGPVLASIEKTWRAKMPSHLLLEAELQKRLSALTRSYRYQVVAHEQLLAVAAEPEKHALLQPRDFELRVTKDGHYRELSVEAKRKKDLAIDIDLIRSILQLVGMVHSETPIGHGARAKMPALIRQTTKLLDSSKPLLELTAPVEKRSNRYRPNSSCRRLSRKVGQNQGSSKNSYRSLHGGWSSGYPLGVKWTGT